MNPSDIIPQNTYLRADQNQTTTTPATTQPVQTGKQPSFLDKLLPMGGGILGGILGTVAAPFTGGIINPIDLGGLLGAGGQAAENALTGRKVLEGNDITSGIENALGNALGGGATSLLTGAPLKSTLLGLGTKAAEQGVGDVGADTLSNIATRPEDELQTAIESAHNAGNIDLENQLTSQLNDQGMNPNASMSAADKTALMSKIRASQTGETTNITTNVPGGLLGKTSNISQGLSSGSLFDQFSKGSGVTKDLASDLNTNYGITNAEKSIPLIHSTITGSADNETGALANKAVMDSLQKAPDSHVDLGNLTGNMAGNGSRINAGQPDFVQSVIDQTHGLNPNDEKTIQTFINNEYGKLPTSVSGSTDNVSAFNLSKSLANKAAGIANQASKAAGSAKASLQATSNVYDQVAKSISDEVLAPGGQALTVSPETVQGVKQGITAAIGKDEPQATTQILSDIDNVTNPDGTVDATDMRSIQSKWVRAMEGLKSTQNVEQVNGGLSSADIMRGTLGASGGPAKTAMGIAAAIPKGKAINQAGSTIFDALSKATGKAAASKIVPLLARTSAVASANVPNLGNDVEPTPGTGANINGGGAMNPNVTSTINDSPLMQQYQLLQSLLLAEPADAQTGSLTSALNSITPQAQKLQTAAPILNNLLSGYQTAGGAQGPLSGGLAKLTGIIPGTAANTYNREQGAAASLIAQLLGISPQAAQLALPQLNQSTGTAAPQVSALTGALGAI